MAGAWLCGLINLPVCLSHTNRHTIREEDGHRQNLGAVWQCDKVATRWGPSPIFGVRINQKRGEVLASPGVGKKGSEVNRCQRRGVGRGGGVSPSGCYQEAQAGPKTEEEGTGPPKGPVLACDWGGGPGSQGGAAGKGLLPTRPRRGAGAQSPLPPSAGPASG